MAQVNMVFGSFNLHDEFFAKHQLNYLADIVRVLSLHRACASISTTSSSWRSTRRSCGSRSRKRAGTSEPTVTVSMQRGLNFEMSVQEPARVVQ